MKKGILITVIVAVGLVLGNYLFKAVNNIRLKNAIDKNTATIPQFNFTTADDHNFTKKDLRDTLGTVIFEVFSPDCSHCQKMADSLIKYKDRLINMELVMVTPFGDSASVSQFITDHHLELLPDTHFLLDTKATFFKIFGYTGVPSFFVYKENKLVKKIRGETKVENLILN